MGKTFGLLLCLMLAISMMVEAAAPMPQEFRKGQNTIKLGDSMEKAVKILRKPILITGNGQNYVWRDQIDLYSPEIILKRRARSKKDSIWSMIIDRQGGITTPEGVGIGTTKEKVIEIYGKTHEYIDHNNDTMICYGGKTSVVKGKKVKKPFFNLRIDAKTQKVKYMIIENPNH